MAKKDKEPKKEKKKGKGEEDKPESPAPKPETTPPKVESTPQPDPEEEKRKREAAEAAKREEDRKKAEEAKRQEDERKKQAEAAAAAQKKHDEEEARKKEASRKAEEEKKKQSEAEKPKPVAVVAASPQPSPASPSTSSQPRRKHEMEDEGVEIHTLEAAVDPSDTKSAEALYNLFPSSVYEAYDHLSGFARDLNTHVAVPEVVLLGPQGHGKSAILEALLGAAFNVVGYDGATKRPTFLHLINNVSCSTPKITIKRDLLLKGAEFDHDVVVPIEDLSKQLAKRNTQFSDEPIFIHWEVRSAINMTFIDTPGLFATGNEKQDALLEASVLSLAKPVNRLLLCVEEAAPWESFRMVPVLKKVDADLSRTTFVFSKFYSLLSTFSSTREVNRFLSGALPDVRSFMVSLPSGRVRARFGETPKFREKVYQAYRRDLDMLEQLQFDKRFERDIGVHALRQYVLNATWRNYQEFIPKILKHLRLKQIDTKKRLGELSKEAAGLNSLKLRAIASNYTVEFLQVVERLLAGTSEGNPSVNGQTLTEEKRQLGDEDWLDYFNQPIKVDPAKWLIPYFDSKLYGGQQFERLLSEFKAVSDHTAISAVTMDDVATASGINKLNNVPNYAWAASDLAQQKSQDALVPLIEQATDRAVYIMKRLTDIAESVLNSRKKKWHNTGTLSIDDIEQYPYFTHHVKDLYFKFVDKIANTCKEKCLDEFYSTRTIYWDLTECTDHSLDRNDSEDTKATVVELATKLFEQLRTRVTKNVLLKFYNFFLVPMQVDLWNEIQSKINSLSDDNLEQIFETEAVKTKLKEDEKALQITLDKCKEQETALMRAATAFAHPLHLTNP